MSYTFSPVEEAWVQGAGDAGWRSKSQKTPVLSQLESHCDPSSSRRVESDGVLEVSIWCALYSVSIMKSNLATVAVAFFFSSHLCLAASFLTLN